MKILVLNSGSSSLKYQVFDFPNSSPLCTGLVERIGLDGSKIKHRRFRDGGKEKFNFEEEIPNHEKGLMKVAHILLDPATGVLRDKEEVRAIGHRVVHGGEQFASTTLVTEEVKEKIEALISLAPLHNPPNLLGIQVAERIFPEAKQVAVFDTAFHQTMPPKAYRFAIPKNLYQNMGIRAYGFHGSSHQYVSKIAIDYLRNPGAKLISIHLGNGSSVTAIHKGISIDHSMGLGPMGGLVMGTRCGDLDPSVIFHLINERGIAASELNDILNKQSGLQGLCGHSDMRDVKTAVSEADGDAMLAYELYAYRIQKYIGSYAATLNGIDAIIFTAGIGENDAEMREKVCSNLDFLGIQIDRNLNQIRISEPREINRPDSKVKILVIPTNEELEIGEQTFRLVNAIK